MPRIPIYQERQALNQGMGVREVSAPRVDTGAMGRSMEQLGKAMGQMAQAQINVEEENAKAWAANTAADASLKWTMRIKEMQETAQPGAANFTSGVAAEFDPWADDALRSAPTETSKKFLQQSFLNLRNTVMSNAITFEATEGRNHRVVLMQKGIGTAAQDVYLNPTEENLNRHVGEQTAIIDALNNTPAEKLKLKEKLNSDLGKAGAEAMAMNSPEALIAQVEKAQKEGKTKTGNPFLDMLDPITWDTYLSKAKVQVSQKQSLFRADLERRITDDSAMALDGIVSPDKKTQDQFVAAYGPEDGVRRFGDWQKTQVAAVDISKMKAMSNEQLVGFLKSKEPKPGAGYATDSKIHDVLTAAASKLVKARNDDPATVAMQTNGMANIAYREMNAVIDNPDTTVEQKRASADRYVTATIAEQERLGITNPKILTAAMRDNLARRMSSGKETAADIAASLENLYGRKNFGRIMEEMMQDNKLSPAMMIIPDLQDMTAREVVSRVSVIDIKTLQSGVSSKDVTTITDRVKEHVAVLRGSGGPASPMMAAQIAAYQETMIKLALDRLGQGSATNAADAADQANKMLLGSYNFKGTLRLPKDVDANKVTNALNFSIQSQFAPSIKYEDVPPDLRQARTQQEAIDEWRSTIMARPIWISNQDTTAAQLWVQGKNGDFYRVKVGGKQVEMPFAETEKFEAPTARERKRAIQEQKAIQNREFDQRIGQ